MRGRGWTRVLAGSVAALVGCAPSAGPGIDPGTAARAVDKPPNFVVITTDDLGYGDLSCYGSRAIRTPVLDHLAADGIRLTAFDTASPVCSPSRAALLTGRYSVRLGVVGALAPSDRAGLPASELTIAEALHARGYATAMIGKWHLGHAPESLPPAQGFDQFFGIPFSSDVTPVQLMRGTSVLEDSADVSTLTERFTDEAVRFVDEHADRPFLLYLAHSAPHTPLLVAERFRGKSQGGRYGDAVESVDWSVGEVLEALRRHGLAENTLVLFTSDNGPWAQGSPGGLRGRKGAPWEGGFRVPFLARWPGHVPAGQVAGERVSSLDIFPTILAAAGVAPAPDLLLDGVSMLPLLTASTAPREPSLMLYFVGEKLRAVRYGRGKMHVSRQRELPDGELGRESHWLGQPELYDLDLDSDESYDVAAEHPDVVADLKRRMRERVATLPEEIRTQNLPALSH